MKKLSALFLAFILIGLLAACNSAQNSVENIVSAEDQTIEQTEEIKTAATDAAQETEGNKEQVNDQIMSPNAVQAYIQEMVDLSHYKTNNVSDDSFVVSLDSEHYPDYKNDRDKHLLSDNSFKLNGNTTIAFDMKIADLRAQGWELKNLSDENTEITPNHATVDTTFTSSGKEVYINCSNNEENNITLKDSVVYGIKLKAYSSDDYYAAKLETVPDFEIEGNINNDSSLKDIIKAYGEPISIYYHIVNNNYSYIKVEYDDLGTGNLFFTLSGDGKKIVEVYFA